MIEISRKTILTGKNYDNNWKILFILMIIEHSLIDIFFFRTKPFARVLATGLMV